MLANMKRRSGVWLEEFFYQPHEGRTYRRLSQPSRQLILDRNATLRQIPGAVRDLSFGRLALTIPLEDLETIRDKYPDLRSKDPEIKRRAWHAFIASSESLPYRVA